MTTLDLILTTIIMAGLILFTVIGISFGLFIFVKMMIETIREWRADNGK